MATTWHGVLDAINKLGAEYLGGTIWRISLPGSGEGRKQTVYVSHEVIQPAYEIVRVSSAVTILTESASVARGAPFSATLDSDLVGVLRELGGMLVGGLGYVANEDDEQDGRVSGQICITSSFPLSLLDLSDEIPFLVYLNMIAQAADGVERQYASNYGKMGTHDIM